MENTSAKKCRKKNWVENDTSSSTKGEDMKQYGRSVKYRIYHLGISINLLICK